jgi:hypothetical protein
LSNEKSNEVKRKLGSKHYKPDATVDLVTLPGVPAPLRRLDDSGLELWKRVWDLGETWLLPQSDAELLQMTCEMVDEREELRTYVLEQPDAWHERKGLRELDRQIISNLSLLGLTPTDRIKLGLNVVKQKSKLEELMAKRDAL